MLVHSRGPATPALDSSPTHIAAWEVVRGAGMELASCLTSVAPRPSATCAPQPKQRCVRKNKTLCKDTRWGTHKKRHTQKKKGGKCRKGWPCRTKPLGCGAAEDLCPRNQKSIHIHRGGHSCSCGNLLSGEGQLHATRHPTHQVVPATPVAATTAQPPLHTVTRPADAAAAAATAHTGGAAGRTRPPAGQGRARPSAAPARRGGVGQGRLSHPAPL